MNDAMTVSDYCKLHKVSSQSVYARIKRGTIESTVVNGIKMVIDNSIADIATQSNDITMLLQSIVADQKKEIKRLHKSIKQNKKERDHSCKQFEKMLDMMRQINTPVLPVIDAEVLEVKPKKKKKKRKKS